MYKPLISSKLEALTRHVMCHYLARRLNLVILTEYPKSGGSWLARMLADYLDIPFPQNRIPSLTSSVMQGHYRYDPRLGNVFALFRDGRDVMISFYYYSFFENELYNSRLVAISRRNCPFTDYHDIGENLPAFIEYKFTRSEHPPFTWSTFANEWLDAAVPYVRYEDLLADTPGTLGVAVKHFIDGDADVDRLAEIAARYSFKNQTGRAPGEENTKSFRRKGIAGDWQNHFSREAREVFDHYGGDALIRLGYENDHAWVNRP